MSKLINFILFQAGWFACVLSAAAGQPLYGLLVVLVVLSIYLLGSHDRLQHLAYLLAVVVIGTVWDSLLVALGLLSYQHGQLLPATAPYWIMAMWASFATTLNRSLAWLQHRYGLAALLGLLGGPAAYYAGAQLGAVTVNSLLAYVALAVGWAVILPLLYLLSHGLRVSTTTRYSARPQPLTSS